MVGRVRSGWVLLGDWQFLSGYSWLLPDPVVQSLNDLSTADRVDFLLDMAVLGDALLAVTDAISHLKHARLPTFRPLRADCDSHPIK